MAHMKHKADQGKDVLTIFEAGTCIDPNTQVLCWGHWCHICKYVLPDFFNFLI